MRICARDRYAVHSGIHADEHLHTTIRRLVVQHTDALRASRSRIQIRACCNDLGYGDAQFSETVAEGTFELRVHTALGPEFSLKDAEPQNGDSMTIERLRVYLLRLIRADLMQSLHGHPKMYIDGRTGNAVVNATGTWEL